MEGLDASGTSMTRHVHAALMQDGCMVKWLRLASLHCSPCCIMINRMYLVCCHCADEIGFLLPHGNKPLHAPLFTCSILTNTALPGHSMHAHAMQSEETAWYL